MHIAFLNPQGNFDPLDSFWTEHPDFGGQLVYVKETAMALAALGHDVDILTRRIIDPKWPQFARPEDTYPGSNVRILRIPCGPPGFLAKEDLWPHLGTTWVPNITGYYRDAGRLPDAFTAHYADGGYAGALLQEASGTPFSFTAHSLGAQKMDKLGASPQNLEKLDERYHFSFRIFAERAAMAQSARIITSTRQERFEQYGHHAYRGAVDPEDEERFSVIPPGVNRAVFSPDPEDIDERIRTRIADAVQRDIPSGRRELPLVLLSSRLDPKKNHLGALKAFSSSTLLRERANLAIVVRGINDPLNEYTQMNASDRQAFRRLVEHANSLDLRDLLVAFPLNSQAELAAAYRVLAVRRSVFCLPALYEPFGLAPLESMSCGLPVVVTSNGGPSESLAENGHRFGVLVDPSDPGDIAAGLLSLIDNPSEWDGMREAGLERVRERYTWQRTAAGYESVLMRSREAAPRFAAAEAVTENLSWPPTPWPLEKLAGVYFSEG